jgi:hypothetical protein
LQTNSGDSHTFESLLIATCPSVFRAVYVKNVLLKELVVQLSWAFIVQIILIVVNLSLVLVALVVVLVTLIPPVEEKVT